MSQCGADRGTALPEYHENLAAKTILRSGSGRVVIPGDSAAFVSAVRQLLEDPVARQQAGRNARSFAESAFNLQSIATQFLDILSRAGVISGVPLPVVPSSQVARSATA